MIVFEKQTGWKPTGEELPGETQVQILVDACREPLAGVYNYTEARKIVEQSIAKNPDAHYRFELVGASAKALAKAGIKGQPSAPKAKRSPAKPKAQPKAATKAKGKAESGKQRHARLKAAGLCTACGKRKAAPKPKAAGGGHYNECSECREYYAQWAKDKAKKAGK